MYKVLFLMVAVAMVLVGCGSGEAYLGSQTLPQPAAKAAITNVVPQTAPAPVEKNLLQQIQEDFARGAANVASGGQNPAQPETYSQMQTGETVRAFNGSVCLKSQAQHTGKAYICPQSIELCSKAGKSIVVDSMGFPSCQ